MITDTEPQKKERIWLWIVRAVVAASVLGFIMAATVMMFLARVCLEFALRSMGAEDTDEDSYGEEEL